jgi:hypothetical protein
MCLGWAADAGTVPLRASTESSRQRLGTSPGSRATSPNLAACPDGTPVTADFVISSYHELWNIEKSFRMSKSDLRARPVCHRKRDSIEAHLTIVFAALAVTRFIEDRTVQIRISQHILTAEDPLPPDLCDALALIKQL